MQLWIWAALVVSASWVFAAPGQSVAAPAGTAPFVAAAPDYAQTSAWVCRPGAESICEANLNAVVVQADGTHEPQPFTPAANPPVDCFYIYPTVSHEQTPYADLTDSAEIQRVVNAQAGRFTSRCRVFAPLYRQATLMHLADSMQGDTVPQSDAPMEDVEAAWQYYLKHDNHGRGVILIGHSQGTILLQRLIAKEIDGTPQQPLLVSAFLAGDPSLGVPAGQRVGGTFKHIPLCSAAAETGCVYAWGSYLAADPPSFQAFGGPRGDGFYSGCENPAAPAGGMGILKSYGPQLPDAPEGSPPWIESVGQLSGTCETTNAGNAFRVTILPGKYAELLTRLLQRAERRPSWGLHVIDIGLVQGNMLDVVDAETAAWKKIH